MTELTTLPAPEAGDLTETTPTWAVIGRSFLDNKLALLGVVLVVAIIGFCFIGPLIYHTNQVSPDLLILNHSPSGQHPLGTDYVGFDILGRLMVAGQSSLEIGLAVAVLATSFGVLWGAVSGYFGGFLDAIMMRMVDIVLAIPALFIFIYL